MPALPDDASDHVAAPGGLGAAALCYLVGLVAGGFATSLAVSAGAKLESISSLVAGLVGEWVGFVGGPWLISRLNGTGSLARDFGLRLAGVADTVRGVVVGAGTYLVVLVGIYPPVLTLVRHLTHHHVSVSQTAIKLGSLGRGPDFVVFAIAVGLGAPFAEELFFRGLLLSALVRRLGALAGIVVSGILFGIAHAGSTDIAAIPALVIFGIALAVLAYRTGRVGPAIVAHVAFNAITVVQLAARH